MVEAFPFPFSLFLSSGFCVATLFSFFSDAISYGLKGMNACVSPPSCSTNHPLPPSFLYWPPIGGRDKSPSPLLDFLFSSGLRDGDGRIGSSVSVRVLFFSLFFFFYCFLIANGRHARTTDPRPCPMVRLSLPRSFCGDHAGIHFFLFPFPRMRKPIVVKRGIRLLRPLYPSRFSELIGVSEALVPSFFFFAQGWKQPYIRFAPFSLFSLFLTSTSGQSPFSPSYWPPSM